MALKALIDRLRGKPEWQHPDVDARMEAVLHLPSAESEILGQIAREDPEPRVRRAAVKKIDDPEALHAIAAKEDEDAAVREEAVARLAAVAIRAPDEARAEAALAHLDDQRHLAQVACSAPREATRRAAVGRLEDARALAVVVRECEDVGIRLLALGRIEDPALLLGFAQKSEHRPVALAAIERITDRAALEAIAGRARVAAASKRARALLARDAPAAPAPTEVAPIEVPSPTPDMDAAERAAYERERLRLEQEAEQRAQAQAVRDELCETLERTAAPEALAALDQVRAAWAALPPLPGPDGARADRRFADADRALVGRHEAWVGAEGRRGELEALCARAEGVVEATDLAAATAGFALVQTEWTAHGSGGAALVELQQRLEAARARLQARRTEARAGTEQQARDNLGRLQGLAERLEALAKAEALALRDADHAVREARAALDAPGPLPGKRDRETLMPRLEAARKALAARLQDLREEAQWKHWANVDVQEDLCGRVEALRGTEDVEEAARQLRDLDARWKQAREAPKDKAGPLWTRFKTARDEVRARVDAHFAKKAEEVAGNLRKKETLCEQAEALAESTDWLKTATALQALQAEWTAGPPLPRTEARRAWERFRKACDRFFTRRDEDRTRRRQEWTANLEKKKALCVRAEEIADSSDWETVSAEVRKLQAEWKQVGPVRATASDAVWQRFRGACDRFFDRYKRRNELDDTTAVVAREALCGDIEALDVEAEGLAEKVLAAQAAWRQAAVVSGEKGRALAARFDQGVARLVEAGPVSFAGTELDPEANLKKMEKLCARAEAALASVRPEERPAESVVDLATRLRDALAANTIGGRDADESKWREASAEIEAAQAAWQRLGPPMGASGRELRARFDRAGAAFVAARPAPAPPPPAARREREPRRDGPRPSRDARPRRE